MGDIERIGSVIPEPPLIARASDKPDAGKREQQDHPEHPEESLPQDTVELNGVQVEQTEAQTPPPPPQNPEIHLDIAA